jgi:uncharacterized repeat protein (TIGR01451 family)
MGATLDTRGKGNQMKLSGSWMGVPVALAAILGLAVACASSSQPDKEEGAEVAQARQALDAEGLDLFLFAPDLGYVGVPTSIQAGVGYFPPCIPEGGGTGGTGGSGGSAGAPGGTGGEGGLPPPPCEAPPPVADVTLTTTIVGNFSLSDFFYRGPDGFSCTQTAIAGGASVTCHDDSFEPFNGGDFVANIVPSTLGDVITTTATLTAGGVEVRSETRQTTIAEPGSDLAVFGPFSGTALVGQPTNAGFFVGNNGPLEATNPTLTLTLSGPGAFQHVGVMTGTCTWTDTTATCHADTFPQFFGIPVDVVFVGNAVGQVSITTTISSDTPDPDLGNNQWTALFDVVEPRVADLAITMTDAPDPVRVNRQLTYSISVTNNGPDTVQQPFVADFLPANTTFVSATPTQGSCMNLGILFCSVGPLAPMQSVSISVVVTPLEGGTISNRAEVVNFFDPFTVDPDQSNNVAVVETTVKGPNTPVTVESFSDRFYTQLGAFIPCANDFVLLEGYLHNSFQLIFNEKSGFYMVTQIFNPQGMTGTGFNTGETYHATGMTRQSQRFTNGFPDQITFENNFRIIGEKTGNDLLVHTTTVVTFNPDGTIKTEVVKSSFECQ